MNRSLYQSEHVPMRSAAVRPAQAQRRASLAPGAEPRIGVIYNPRSHRNKGQDLACTDRPGIRVAQPRRRADIAVALAEFAEAGIDYLIINGGDGTVRDVLTMGQDVFGGAWPMLAVLPKGKTNALNVDLGAPRDWSLANAIAALHEGRRVRRRPLAIRSLDRDEPAVHGFILGAGAFTVGVSAGQDAHQLGFFNSLAVTLTALWGGLQAFFGTDRNAWRRGTELEVRLQPGDVPLPRSRYGDPARRIFMLATTLRAMPAGVKPFGPLRDGLKLAVLDTPRRRLLLALPAILYGWRPRWLPQAGIHQLDAQAFDMTIGEPFILDGEAFPPGRYAVGQGPELTFVVA